MANYKTVRLNLDKDTLAYLNKLKSTNAFTLPETINYLTTYHKKKETKRKQKILSQK